MASINLPLPNIQDSAEATKLFFEQYGTQPYEFTANEINSAVAFFEKKGFKQAAARSTAIALLRQARFENIPVFQLIDTLEGFDELKLSAIVAEILNNNRKSISTLGYKVVNVSKRDISRDVDA